MFSLDNAVPEMNLADTAIARSTYSDRSCTPQETLNRIAPLLPAYGITRLARLTDLDRLGIPVWNAVAPNARSIVINQGKGVTDIDAQVSAAMEALERAVAGNPPIDKRVTSWTALIDAGGRAERLHSLTGIGQDDIHPDELIEWVAGVDLMRGGTTYVPFAAIRLDRTKDERFWQSSDGLASGNTLDEATLHGLLERIERDAYALWQVQSRLGRDASCIAAASFADPVVADLESRIAAAGLKLALFDMTSDIGIPCYSALLGPSDIRTMRQPRYPDVTHGSGAHPNPVRAAIRAITEAAQSRLTFISGARDDIHPSRFAQPLPVETRQCFAIDPTLKPVPAAPNLSGAAAHLAHTLDCLRRAGIDTVVAVSMAGKEMPFFVVKTLVPQLENPDGPRKRRFGTRAISRVLETE
jgi:YcaO-like protein with predicted kinase domain